MDIRNSNIKRPSDKFPDGYSIFEYQTSTLPAPRWIFDIQISNVHLTSSQMDIRNSNIKRPSDKFPDGYSIFKYIKGPSDDLPDGYLIFEYQTSIKHPSDNLPDGYSIFTQSIGYIDYGFFQNIVCLFKIKIY